MIVKRVGLLGGTFGYAHYGHLYISLEAIKRLKLNEVWWLICKDNPLKNHANIDYRMMYAKDFVSKYCRIKVLLAQDFRTYNEILSLKRKYNNIDFVWMMGVDNLISFHSWDQSCKINQIVSIVIFNRGKYIYQPLKSKFAIRNSNAFTGINFYNRDWCTLRIREKSISSSEMGNRRM